MALLRRFGFVALAAIGAACGGDEGPQNPAVNSVAVNAGNNQVGVAGQALATPLAVIARDAGGAPVSGVTVTWAAATGGGSVAPPSSTTNASGIASATRTLGPGAGPQTTTATVSGVTPATFSAVAQIQGATNMGSRFQSPLTDTVLATTVGEPLIAVVTNQTGAPVPGVIVDWTASGGGTVSQAKDTTDAGGEAQVNYTFGSAAGTYGAQAIVTGLVGSPVSYTLTAGHGAPAVLAKNAGDNLTAAPSAQVIHTVITRDAHNNPANGVTIDWALGAGGGSLNTTQNITGGNGTASVTRTLGPGTGSQTVTATAAALTGAPTVTFTTTVATVVQVSNNQFTPAMVTITAGSDVVWQWQGTTVAHNVTFSTGGAPANITDMTSGSASRTFSAAGVFNYSCTNHLGMNGQVTVN
jgi:plastocyanin